MQTHYAREEKTTRYEIKMTCDELYLPNVRSWVQLHPELFSVAYPPRRVNNVYLDTPEADSLADNLDGSGQRSKLRLRWYGETRLVTQSTFELKCKANQLGWKEYCPIPGTFDLTKISWPELLPQLRTHAVGSIAVWLTAIDWPVLINTYMREYYESIDHQIRVTIDYNLAAYEQVTSPMPNISMLSFIDRLVVVEAKSDETLHRRLSNVLTSFPLRVERNSKYVNGVLDSLCFA